MKLIPTFHYQVDWQPRSWRPGEHPAAVNGDGGFFRGERPLSDAAQARFLSVRATIRDPLRRLWVRENQQRAALEVFVVVDISGSMRIGGEGSHCRLAGDLMASAAMSVHRSGDRIGTLCAGARIEPQLTLAASRRVQPVLEISRRIQAMAGIDAAHEHGFDSVTGMLDAWRRLPMRRSLVLIVSDFHAPVETWAKILGTLRHHQVVPVVTHDSSAMPVLPRWGLVHLDDAESGQSRTLLMRPSLQRRLTMALERRRARLDSLFEDFALRPCHLRRPFDPAQLTDHFHGAGLRKPAEDVPGTAAAGPRAGIHGTPAATRGRRAAPPQPAR